MNRTEFTNVRDSIIRQYYDGSIIQNNEMTYGCYTMTSANLSNYIPDMSPAKHQQVFAGLLTHQRLSILEQQADLIPCCSYSDNLADDQLQLLKTQPSIICTFHTGSYRIINSLLVQKNISFSLVLGSSIIAAEGESYLLRYKTLTKKNKNAGLTIIDAENPNSGLQMIRELKKGKSLLLYIDGNSGAGVPTTRNNNSCLINFLNQQLFARKGIGFLAHATNVPVIPAISYRADWDDIRIKFYDPIYPDLQESRDRFAQKITQKLYDILAPMINQYPEQWEAWLYLHKVANIINRITPCRGRTSGTHVQFNLRDYGMFQIDKRSFLFKKNNYTSYPIETSLYKKLRQCAEMPVNKTKIETTVLTELEENGVLHYL